MLWGQVIEYWGRWQPEAVGLRFEDRDVTWAELDRSTDELAAGLARMGVGHGERIGILLNNRPEFVETAMACMKLGAIGVPVNVRFTPSELLYVFTNAECRVIVTEDTLAAGLSRVVAEHPGLPILNADDGTLDEARDEGARPPAVEIEPSDPLFICFTSGTTGDPKGAVLTHASWHYAALSRALQRWHQPPRPPAPAVPAGVHRRAGDDDDGPVVGGHARARAGLRPGPRAAVDRGPADHRVHGRAGDLPAARRSSRLRGDRHLLDPVRVGRRRPGARLAAGDLAGDAASP